MRIDRASLRDKQPEGAFPRPRRRVLLRPLPHIPPPAAQRGPAAGSAAAPRRAPRTRCPGPGPACRRPSPGQRSPGAAAGAVRSPADTAAGAARTLLPCAAERTRRLPCAAARTAAAVAVPRRPAQGCRSSRGLPAAAAAARVPAPPASRGPGRGGCGRRWPEGTEGGLGGGMHMRRSHGRQKRTGRMRKRQYRGT